MLIAEGSTENKKKCIFRAEKATFLGKKSEGKGISIPSDYRN
jgi:hypothetical protein